jgi:hypothetical protein
LQNIDQDANSLAVIEDSAIKYASFSNMVEKTANNGYQVNVRLPSNVFNFTSETPITVSGSLEMQLAGSGGRKLRSGEVAPESAIFKLDIALSGVTDDVASVAQTVKEEGKAHPGYLIPLLAAVGFVSLTALSGMAVTIHHKRGAQYEGSGIGVEV